MPQCIAISFWASSVVSLSFSHVPPSQLLSGVIKLPGWESILRWCTTPRHFPSMGCIKWSIVICSLEMLFHYKELMTDVGLTYHPRFQIAVQCFNFKNWWSLSYVPILLKILTLRVFQITHLSASILLFPLVTWTAVCILCKLQRKIFCTYSIFSVQ